MSRSKQFGPLESLDQIEEGVFLSDANEALRLLGIELARFRERHGDKAKKAKAVLTCKIELTVLEPSSETYQIKTGLSASKPGRPFGISHATEAFDDRNQPCLFVRNSGSDAGNPRQRKLATRTGAEVDPESGLAEVREP
jgi:hypothetical protein